MKIMMYYKGIKFDDHSHSAGDGYDYNWSQICAACAHRHGIYFEVFQNDGPCTLACGVEGCKNEAAFYIDFDGSEYERRNSV